MHWTHSYFEHAYARRWSLGPPSVANRAEAAHFLTLLRANPELPLLDVGCGHGRYTVALASHDRRVVGIDASRSLLDLAARQTAGAGPPPLWVRGDMRRLPFPAAFSGAVLLDSFGFYDQDEENALVLEELRRVLLPTGRLIIAVANPTAILADFRPRDVEQRGFVTVEVERTLQRHPAQLIEDLTVREGVRVARYQRRQRLYASAELRALAEAAAFEVQAVFADYMGARFEEPVSAKLVLLAEAAA